MKVIIMGCGRIGSTLASHLSVDRHDVCVLDRDPDSRDLLPAAFAGRFLVGNGYNRGLLVERAGIDTADAFVAVTSGDNTNLVGARIAKEHYRVPEVIARIYDPRRAEFLSTDAPEWRTRMGGGPPVRLGNTTSPSERLEHAAVATLRHGGGLYAVPAPRMPSTDPVAATLRF
jgi:2-polyprenyl-6-methoxyphenol hydroxylase-like FAD-dependent oxidoreductase